MFLALLWLYVRCRSGDDQRKPAWVKTDEIIDDNACSWKQLSVDSDTANRTELKQWITIGFL